MGLRMDNFWHVKHPVFPGLPFSKERPSPGLSPAVRFPSGFTLKKQRQAFLTCPIWTWTSQRFSHLLGTQNAENMLVAPASSSQLLADLLWALEPWPFFSGGTKTRSGQISSEFVSGFINRTPFEVSKWSASHGQGVLGLGEVLKLLGEAGDGRLRQPVLDSEAPSLRVFRSLSEARRARRALEAVWCGCAGGRARGFVCAEVFLFLRFKGQTQRKHLNLVGAHAVHIPKYHQNISKPHIAMAILAGEPLGNDQGIQSPREPTVRRMIKTMGDSQP